MKITGIILAGGKSSRMGTDKGLVLIDQIPMVERVIQSIVKAGITEIIIIAKNPDYKNFGFPVFPDIIEDKGPLGGIYTGLMKSTTSKNLILSCDIPFINEDVIRKLVELNEDNVVSVVKYEKKIHNLIGIYDNSLVKDLGEHLIANKLKVGQFLESKSVHIIDLKLHLPELDLQVLANVNTSEELKILKNEM